MGEENTLRGAGHSAPGACPKAPPVGNVLALTLDRRRQHIGCTRGQFEGGNFPSNKTKEVEWGLRMIGGEKKFEWREGKDKKC
jgi:hypothetical protein